MTLDLKTYPYFDTTDAEIEKGYVRVVGAGNYYIQGRDISVMQGLIHEHERRVSSTIYTNGSVLEGCQLVIQTATLTVILTPGLVYYNGYVIAVKETELTMTASGKEIVGLDIEETLVESEDDPTLKGQYPGSIAYGSPGFPRLQLKAVASLVPASATTLPLLKLYELIDGQPKTLFEVPYMSNLYNILARRTFDESGSYVISGLNLYNGTATSTTIDIFVGAGKAYIEGYEIIVPSNLSYTIDRALETAAIEGEVQSYVNSSTTTVFTLYNQPADTVTQVAAEVKISASITKGIDGGEDDLRPYQPSGQSASTTLSIISIDGGAYSAGVSYNLSANHVDWVVGQPQPAQGATYACIWTYRKIMVADDDYIVTKDDVTAGGTCYVELTGTGDLPVNSTLIEFDYSYFLYRHDLVYMDRYGDVHVQRGSPNTKFNAKPPFINDARVLTLGYAIIPPLATEAHFISKPTRAITMKQLNTLIDYIELLAYNQAVENLDNEAMIGEPATSLRGILTDGILGYTKVDLGHPDFNATFDFDTNSMTNRQLHSGHDLTVNTANTTARINKHIVTLPYEEITLVKQQQANAVQVINPYTTFNIGAILELTPDSDIWTDTITVAAGGTIVGGTTNINVGVDIMRRLWPPRRFEPEYTAAALQNRTRLTALGVDTGNTFSALGRGNVTYGVNNALGRTVTQTVVAQWVRGNTVEIYGYNFTPLSDLLTLYVDNHELPLVATNPTYEGSITGTLTSDADGVVRGTFTIPNEFYECGTLKVRLTNAYNEAVATYTAGGKTIYIYLPPPPPPKPKPKPVDPLAQSFDFDDNDYFITGVGLYFAVKDATNPVEIEIRNMENGFPGTEVLASKLLQPAEILTSENGGTIETKVIFDDPIFCEKGVQYCFVVKTDSDTASLWSATLGGTDLITESRIIKNPYGIGIMFSSSNAVSWSIHQSTDLKFNLYGARFLNSASVTVEYNPFTATLTTDYVSGTSSITYNGYSRICLLADPIVLTGTSIEWEYGVTTSASAVYTWSPLEPYVDIELTSSLVEHLKVRAVMTGTEYVTPIINKSQTGFVGLLTTQHATYITKNVQMEDTYDTVKQYIDVYLPDTATCSFAMSYASDTSGSTWQSAVGTSVSSVAIGNDYYRWTLEPPVTAVYTAFRARVDIETDHPLHRVIARRFMNIAKVAI